jgi:hypothetical protein
VLPTPLEQLSKDEVADWLELHAQLVAATRLGLSEQKAVRRNQPLGLFDTYSNGKDLDRLVQELNERVYQLLNLRETERLLVEDFVHVKRFANKGKVVEVAAGIPTDEELRQYGKVLAQELDNFFEDEPNYRHAIKLYRDPTTRSGMIEIRSRCNSANHIAPEVIVASEQLATEFARIRELVRDQRAQWLYFDRNLRIFEGTTTFLLKPLQRIHWLRSQALLDVDAIISDILTQGT